MDYAGWVTALSTLTAIAPTEDEFVAILPSVINDAEGTCYRDLNPLSLDVTDGSATTTAGSRNFTLPTALCTFQIVRGLNVITPASTAPNAGNRRPLRPVSRAVLDMCYSSSGNSGVPECYCYDTQSTLSGQSNILLGPWPDSTYFVEVTGKAQWVPLSASNTSTFLTLYLPDLFLAASMIFMTGYMKNWGAQAGDPQSGLSWKSHYDKLMEGSATWEARKRMAGASWTALQIEPSAQPQRG
jgi:hypothetical protein